MTVGWNLIVMGPLYSCLPTNRTCWFAFLFQFHFQWLSRCPTKANLPEAVFASAYLKKNCFIHPIFPSGTSAVSELIFSAYTKTTLWRPLSDHCIRRYYTMFYLNNPLPEVNFSYVFCRFVNDELHIRKRIKNIFGRHPVERSHGESVIASLPDSKLFGKVIEWIEGMASIEFLVVFSVAALYLAVMSWGKRANLFVADPHLSQSFSKRVSGFFLLLPISLVNSKPLSVWTHSMA